MSLVSPHSEFHICEQQHEYYLTLRVWVAYLEVRSNRGTLTSSIECVDDPDSRYYGRIVDRASVDQVDWKSSEKMSSIPQYRWGVIVSYNMDQPVRGDGSCIFLHQWRGSTNGTSGCTAMSPEDIEALVHWMNGQVRAVLVQLPEPEYERLRTHWQLP